MIPNLFSLQSKEYKKLPNVIYMDNTEGHFSPYPCDKYVIEQPTAHIASRYTNLGLNSDSDSDFLRYRYYLRSQCGRVTHSTNNYPSFGAISPGSVLSAHPELVLLISGPGAPARVSPI